MIKIKKLSKTYLAGKANQVEALKNVSLNIDKGEMIALTGPSGSGKSTLLHILALMDTQTSGEYFLMGKNVKDMSEKECADSRNRKIGMILQDYGLIEELTALQNVQLPLIIAGENGKRAKKKAITALETVGLEKQIKQSVNRLSGGQRQRVAIARAMVTDAQIILADEPTGALDKIATNEFMALMTKMNEKGATIIIATHNEAVAKLCKRRIYINDGIVSEQEEM